MGIREVVVQWTSFEAFDTYPRATTGLARTTILSDLLQAAEAERVAVWIGLHSENGFWSIADTSPEEIAHYFSQRLQDLEARLPALLSVMNKAGRARSPVAGWYISEEIDDTRWTDPKRRALLDDYMIQIRRRLAAAQPGPVMVSAFANGAQTPAEYAAYLRGLADRAGIDRLLFQDGVGAGKLSVEQATGYLQALQDRAGRSGVVPIVELFDVAPDGLTQPATLSRILDQIDAEAPFASPAFAAFAIPHHMLAAGNARAAALLRDWRAMSRHCTRKQDQKDR